MASLDFSGKEQLYYQLYDILFQDILSGAYAVGELIPSESELMRRYGISRATARKAMEMLAANGLINKRRGHGSEVVSNHPSSALQHVKSYLKKNVVDKSTSEKRLIDATIMPAGKEIAAALDTDPGTELYRLRRVRYSGEQPFYLEMNYYERSFVPHAIEHDFSRESLRAYFSSELDVHWRRAVQQIYSIAADRETAPLLQLAFGAPLLYIRRISFDAENRPRECVMTYYRADLYHLEIELDS
ncbi:transcriptional regulator, GntR family [Coriobacterium glomerans PW2]|uniref:Transcriptional regulator, GntR family n=1 Tax=Coriobacterium glomerans (strain ATCC 49209 / DSM 20642 / JCM 10262 / PW2) TaxID=700015 RepID=F2N9Y9_CORGP|nr:GntR family transcriptional regulator [Coriobacterium glomerans]AEB06244.1 transcriptional regulator, GntR family [Coriobacterium glomerans PW2]